MLRSKKIDLNSYQRMGQFKHFQKKAYPYVGCTVNVDVTNLLEQTRQKGEDFFLTFLYHLMGAANAVPEFRQRIINGEIWELDSCKSSHIINKEDFTYSRCTLDYNYDLDEFLDYAKKEEARAKQADTMEEEDMASLLYISTKSWIFHFASMRPFGKNMETNPQITLGRYVEDEERKKAVMPVSILCHHALVDDVHIKKFFKELRERLSRVEIPEAA